MSYIVLNSQQMEFIINRVSLQEKWNQLDVDGKRAVVEYTKILTNTKKPINEGTWLNTVGDIVGIFDPTGVVDFVNGITYFAQGDTLFGLLSMVSAVPYVGDLVAKPILLGGKGVKAGMSGLKAAMATGKSAEIASAATKAGGKTAEFVKSADKWAPQVKGLLEKGKNIPLVGRFFKRIESWLGIMKQASVDMKVGVKSTKGILPKSAFRNYGIDMSKNVLSRTFQRGGFLKNRKLSMLLYKTKFWLGFLDYVGVGNFVGPEEFEKQYGEEQTKKAMDSYMGTEKGASEYKSEIEPSLQEPTEPVKPQEPESPSALSGAASAVSGDLVKMVFGGII